MPGKPKRLCIQSGCSGLYDPATRTCNKCSKKGENKRHGTRQERGYDERWIRLRKRKKAANPLCEKCERNGHTTLMDEVHHIVPFRGLGDPLRLDWDNLESLCKPCHVKASAHPASEVPEGAAATLATQQAR